MNILEKKSNPLLSRTEIKAEIEYTGVTPSNEEVKQQLTKNLSANAELIVVKQIISVFGEGKSSVSAYLYENKEAMARIERAKKKKPKPGETPEEEAKPASEKPKEPEKTEEKPPEKPKEEAKPVK